MCDLGWWLFHVGVLEVGMLRSGIYFGRILPLWGWWWLLVLFHHSCMLWLGQILFLLEVLLGLCWGVLVSGLFVVLFCMIFRGHVCLFLHRHMCPRFLVEDFSVPVSHLEIDLGLCLLVLILCTKVVFFSAAVKSYLFLFHCYYRVQFDGSRSNRWLCFCLIEEL